MPERDQPLPHVAESRTVAKKRTRLSLVWIVPIVAALVYLLLSVQRGSTAHSGQRVRLYRMVELIGRWSMVDVFVDTFTAALIQLQPLMSVEPGPGLIFFAAVVVFTMLAVESFDPRLIWDSVSPKETGSSEVTYA